MEFHGQKDATINYTGGLNTRQNAYSADIVTWVDDWAKRDGFKVNDNNTSTLCNGPTGNKLVTKFTWGDEMVVHYRYKNLDHDWPSNFPNPDTKDKLTCKEAEATPIILEWFKKWTS
jgi:poly(3-hydroxybutyrate) depolymerase